MKRIKKILSHTLSHLARVISFPSKMLPSRWLRKMDADQRRFFNLIVTGIVLVIGTWTITSLLSPDKSEAAWWNDSWLYRQTVPINNGGTTQSDFQVQVILDTSVLIASGKMQADCDDVRFTGQNGDLLPFFQATACDATKTRYWVRVDSIPVGDSNIYLYYGNTSAQTASDRDSTFDVDLLGSYSQTFSDSSIATNHGLTSDRENNFFISNSTIVNRFNTSWVYQQQFGTLDIYTGICYDDKRDRFYGIDWSSKQWSTFDTSFTEIAPMDQTLGNEPIDCTTDSTYIYTNHRNGIIGRNAIADNTNSTFNMDTLSGFNWGGQGITYAYGYLFVGTTGSYGSNGNRIYVLDIEDWNNPRIVTYWDATGYGPTEVSGLTWKDKYIYQTARNNDFANEWTGPVKTAATEPVVGAPINEEQSEGPVLHLSFNEGNGATANDSSSNNNDGTISGATWKNDSNCLSGKCLSFDGTDDYVSINDNSSVDLAESWTVGGWFKPSETAIAGSDGSGTPRQMLISKWYSSASTLINYSLDISGTGKLRASVADGSTSKSVSSTTILSPNTWYHLQATFDGDTGDLKVYINGKLEGTNATGFTAANTNIGNIRLGQFDFAWSSYRDEYRGLMDEVKIYPYVRTQEQMYQDFNSGAAYVLGAQDNNLTDGLVGYWRLSEASGNTLADSSGNSHTATASDSDTGNADTDTPPTVTTGKYGNARNFDGTDDSVAVPHNAALNVGTTYTVSAWIKPDTISSDQHILGMNSGPQFNFKVSSTGHIHAVAYRSQSGSWPSYDLYGTNGKVVTGQWQHITMTVSGTNIKVFYNGQLDKEGTIASADTTAGTSGIKIGQSGMSWSRGWFDGSIGDVRLYNRTLSPAEVTQLYNSAPPPITSYDFEQNNSTTLTDTSGNNNTGTWNGSGTQITSGKYGKGGYFNGTDKYVNIPSYDTLDYRQSYTIESWIKPAQLGNTNSNCGDKRAYIISTYASNTEYVNTELLSSGVLAFKQRGSASVISVLSSPLSINEWYHFAAIHDSTTQTLKLYVNGALQGTTSTSGQSLLNPSGQPLRIGWNAHNCSNSYFQGDIDQIQLYNYARTPGQIIEDMNAGHPIGGSPVGSQVGYWKLDEGTGTIVNDNAPGGNNGTITGATWTTGKTGKALSFDGSDYITVGNISAYKIDTKTVSFWAKPTASPGSYVGIFSAGGSANYYAGFHTSNRLILSYSNSSGSQTAVYSDNNAMILNEWHHYTYTMDVSGSTITTKFYRDGNLLKTVTNTDGVSSTYGSTFMLGSFYTSSGFYTGLLDEVKIYNTALTDEEIKTDYNLGQSLQFGVLGTEADGTPSNSSDRAYCPPGDTTASCGPVGEWKFDDRYGTTPKDTSGSGYNGTFVGTPTWTQGKIGSALDFNGSNQYVTMGDNLDLIGSPLTISVWVKPRNHVAYGGIVSKLASAGNYRLVMNDTSGKLSFGIRASDNTFQAMASNSTLPLNEWSHIVVTYDNATTAKMYINGKLDVQSSAFTVSRGDATTALAIGYNSNNAAYFDGAIDNVQLYNYVRSDAQIAWDYSRGAPVAHYKLNECQGGTVHSSTLPYNSALNGTITIGASGTQTSVGTCQTSGTAWGNGASGKFGSSLNFDGTNDYVDIGDPASGVLDITGDLTVSAWVRPSNLTGIRFILSKLYLGEFELGTNNDGLIWRHGNGSTYSGPQWNSFFSEGTDTWYHVVVVRTTSNTTLSVYKNGQSFGTPQTYSVTPTASTNSLYIGSRSGGSFYFNGQIDDVQIYNYALTQQQIKDVMNQGAIRFGP